MPGIRRFLVLALAVAATFLPVSPTSALPQGTEPETPEGVPIPVVPTEEGSEPGEPGTADAEPLLELDRLAADEPTGGLPLDLQARPVQGMPATMAALMLGSREGGQISMAPLAFPVLVPPPSADDDARAAVALVLELDGASLLGPSPAGEPVVEVYAYALRPDNSVAGFLAQSLPLDLAELGEALFVGGVKFFGHLELPPGDYSLRILVYEKASQRFGLSQVAVSVPQRAALLAPLVAETPDTPWLLAGEARHGSMGALDPGRVLDLAGVAMPAALPLLRGSALTLDLLLYGAAGARLPERLEVRVRDASGQAAPSLEAEVVERSSTSLPGLERLRVRVPLDALVQGSYYLSFVAPGLGGAEASSADLAAVVLRGDDTAELWTDIRRRLAGEAMPSLDFEEIQQRRRGRQERVRQAIAGAYLQVLERLAGGDRAGALQGLAQVEREVLESGQEAPLELLREAQTEVLSRIGSTTPAALLPVALLHGRAYEMYRDELDFSLSTRAREMAVALVERYATRSEEETAKRLASTALASFGAYLQTAQVRTTGRALLERALELDPDNRFALINLAVGLEKTGDFQEAVGVLQRLVEIDPKAGEGRLRMAVNLRRLGQDREAGQWLRRLVGEVNEDWILAIAYQELGSLMLQWDRPGDAVAILEQGAGRLPEQERLEIQLAYALDRAGEPRRAREVMARVSPAPATASPRHRYSDWPDLEAGESNQSLQEAALVRLPALRGALAEIPPTGEAGRGGRR